MRGPMVQDATVRPGSQRETKSISIKRSARGEKIGVSFQWMKVLRAEATPKRMVRTQEGGIVTAPEMLYRSRNWEKKGGETRTSAPRIPANAR